ncbi:hypothetical protein [Noviherbaspirillum aridicola]|uniref:Uncharacterized protein n=1 Tax=Noviherbaspirillum aridicola TaxID=2849687 RepID=A0ABQ4Q9Z7_9BURK|nr:hypothetical protein [Noviherbaspirillum aridicola]GIZ54057.1 hypothetical protein NCCP691_40710 [Noviherbaspirillum aridicola]
MKVSRQFIKDFAYLANRYGWTPAEIEEIKAHTRAHPAQMRVYWTALAAAHRAGYEQTQENGYIRLQAWCAEQGIPDPFANLSKEEA